ncbi:ABC transporter permease subunit [Allobranchiibius sp. GilTou73]|uniref:ABC transporter permease subunit n=1 Tax=Allobranchiibius sp. GilTou73 TaxID=2904523 RepID=UPI001F20E434|nr:ABC transporter permease subunit [Allobranchiibius sp. GilTou73]UIJ36146.1 hypothetical protein LVQ62_07200 [Allobranchiibius sp. GilTou73]
MSTPTRGRGVIHDIGYRSFEGRRRGTGAIAASLYVTSLRNCFGLGRSGKSKIVPWLMAALILLPAVVLAGLILQLKKMALSDQADLFAPLSNYFGLPYWTQLLVTIFAAAQAPVLFSRDLRYRTIVLYFARPLSRSLYVLMRLAALATALFAVIVVPITIWYAVALTSDLDHAEHTRHYFSALFGITVLALVLAAVSGLIAALATRAGLAVAAGIAVLLVSSGVVTAVLGASAESDSRTTAQIAAAFNPFTAVASLTSVICRQPTPSDTIVRPHGFGWGAFFVVVSLLWIAVPTLLLMWRTRKAASL